MVQTHRCPATVSGSKSAETTEVLGLGKVQRVGKCREPGDLPYLALRRPFEGKGRQHVCADPDRSRLGFFYACCFPCRVGQPFFLPCGGRGGEGEASRGSSRSVASLCPPFPCRNGEKRVLGLLDSVQAHQYMREQSHGSPPVLGVWSKRPERRRARAALCAPHGLAVWQRIHTPVRISGGFSRQEGGEEHDLRDCGTLH